MSDERSPLAVGDIIHGFANGAFGRDSYDCRRIEAVGPDWIVTRNENGVTDFVGHESGLLLCQVNREPVTSSGHCCDFVIKKPLTAWKA